MYTKLRLSSAVKELLTKIANADVVRIDDELFTITKKSDYTDVRTAETEPKIEDFEIIFETDFHTFNWWEITCDVTRVSDKEWKVGNNVLCFLTVQPI